MIFKSLREDIASIRERDPAARSGLEVLLCYPGLHAVLVYRLSHRCWGWGFKLLGRVLSYMAKIMTGIEIHPAARIGRRLFIDHGTGVVIGETAEIGDDVTLYHDVTLGGTTLNKGKRHPTLHDGVIVGAGAQVLGPIVVASGARVGANAVVLSDVAAGVSVVGIPARPVAGRAAVPPSEFCAYGVPDGDLPDPMVRVLDGLRGQISDLQERLARLEAEREGRQ